LATLDQPFHCEFDHQGNLLIADAMAGKIRRVDRTSGLISTIAGNGSNGPGIEGSLALDSTIGTPYAIAAHKNGDLYIVDQQTPVVRKVIADVADWRVRRVDLKTGIITTFAGKGKPAQIPARSKIGDGGKAADAVIVGARGVCVDRQGNTYICEREGNAIRKVDESGTITTIAGTGRSGYSGDGADARLATFRGPKGIRADLEANLYVVDTENHAIRKIDAKSGVVTTVAGGRKGSGGDGKDPKTAGLSRPHGCLVGADGTLYIADSENHRVRRVLPQ
jgi:sugar lactone lactonase YvrE